MLLIILSLLCFFNLVEGLRERGGIYKFSFLGSAVFAGFIIPQIIGLSGDSSLPAGGIEKFTVMSIACLLMITLGERSGTKPFTAFAWSFETRYLLIVACVLSLVGSFFFFQLSRIDEDLYYRQWSGVSVAYRFFASLLTYGLAIAVLVFCSSKSKYALAILLFDTIFYIDRIFVAARRGDTIEFVCIFLLGLWFCNRLVVGRVITVIALIGASLFLHSTGEYRRLTSENSLIENLVELNFLDNVSSVLSEGGPEVTNAVYQISATDETGDFDYGAFQWNVLINNYVPAQLVGVELKNSLQISTEDAAFVRYSYEPWTGSTNTGMTDAFRSFWYFGSGIFFLISYCLRRIYAAAMQGNVVMQLFFMLMIVNALHSITHHTHWFFSPWVHLFIFLIPLLFVFKRKIRATALRSA